MHLLFEGNRKLQHEAHKLLDPEDGNPIPTVWRKFPLSVEQLHDHPFGKTDSNDGIVEGGVPLWPWFDDLDSDDSTFENVLDNSSEETQDPEAKEEALGNNASTRILQPVLRKDDGSQSTVENTGNEILEPKELADLSCIECLKARVKCNVSLLSILS